MHQRSSSAEKHKTVMKGKLTNSSPHDTVPLASTARRVRVTVHGRPLFPDMSTHIYIAVVMEVAHPFTPYPNLFL